MQQFYYCIKKKITISMINLEKFFTNPFVADRHSFGDEQRFSEEHIGSLTAQNSTGEFSAILANTIAVHTAYFGDFTNVKIKEAVRQSQTQIVDKIINDFTTRTTRLNAYLIAMAVDKTPAYQQFFPLGVTEFTRDTNKTNAESHIDRLLAAISANLTAAGGMMVLNEYQAFKANYAAARNTQLIQKADTEATRTTRNEKGLAWADQVYSNLLLIAHKYRHQPDRLGDFFTQSILRPQSKADYDKKGQLAGVVRNALTGEPEVGAIIHVIDGKINDAHTKPDGSYRTQRLPIGSYTVVVSKTGLEAYTTTLNIQDEGDTVLDVTLG